MVYNPPCHAVYEVVGTLLLLQKRTKSIMCTPTSVFLKIFLQF